MTPRRTTVGGAQHRAGAADNDAHRRAAERDRVIVSVADTGTGIALQDSDRLFNPLFTTKSDGMGMGLPICRAIIEAHEGRLWYAPNTPGGAVFQFTLQADKSAAAAV